MMSSDSAHQHGWEIAEVVFGVPFFLGLAVQRFFPLALAQGILKLILVIAGTTCILSGIGIIVLARRELAQYRQPTDPNQPTSRLVTTGVFSMSRNPLYLGGALFFAGIALALNNLWAVTAFVLSIVLCHFILIVPEETYLEAKFGGAYQVYTASVHRWFGRK